MKLAYFVIIIIVIYIIASQIKVVHIDTLPNNHQKELEDRSKVRSMLINNYVKDEKPNSKHQFEEDRLIGLLDKYSSEQFQSTDYKTNYQDLSGGIPELPNGSNLMFLIKSEFVDDQYKFNTPNLPVTTRNNGMTKPIDNKYL